MKHVSKKDNKRLFSWYLRKVCGRLCRYYPCSYFDLQKYTFFSGFDWVRKTNFSTCKNLCNFAPNIMIDNRNISFLIWLVPISLIVCVFLQCGMRIIMFWNYFARLLKFSNICKFSCHFFSTFFTPETWIQEWNKWKNVHLFSRKRIEIPSDSERFFRAKQILLMCNLLNVNRNICSEMQKNKSD